MSYYGKLKLTCQMKRKMRRKAEDSSKEDTGSRRVKFSSLDTIHTFADESAPCPRIAVDKAMPQRTEVENPKTSEYRYFKKLKTFNDHTLTCLQSSKSDNEHQGLVAYKHFSEVMNGNITDSCDKTRKSIHSQTCISPFLEKQPLDVRAKNRHGAGAWKSESRTSAQKTNNMPVILGTNYLLEKDKLGPAATPSSHCEMDVKSDFMCSPFQTDFKKPDNYGKVFHRKRKKLQDLCARALSIEKGDLILYGSKSVTILLQRLKIPNNGNIDTTSQEDDPECSKDVSVAIEKKLTQSNFHPETHISLDWKYDLKKDCAELDILSNAEGLGHAHGDKNLNTKTSNFQHEESLSLISWQTDKVHQYDYDSNEYRIHGLADVDVGTHLLCTKEQLAQEAGIDHGNILASKIWHFSPVFSRKWSDNYNHKHSLEDFPLFTDILQPNRHFVLDSLPVKKDELGLAQWNDLNCKSPNFFSMNSINMQLLDQDRFRGHEHGSSPETGMILWTLPENKLCFSPLLTHEDKHKYYEEESIPGNSVVLWGSSYKDIRGCDKIQDFSFPDISQNFSLARFVGHNEQDNVGPDLGFSFPSKLLHGTDSWEWKDSSLHFLSSELYQSEVQHKLLNTDDTGLIEEVLDPGVSTLISFPYRIRQITDSPMKLHLEQENDINIPNNCVTKGKEWDHLAEPIYPVDCGYDSYAAEHFGLKF